MATALDLVTAGISFLVLIFFILKNKIKKKKYLWGTAIYVLIMTIGVVCLLIFGISFQKTSESIARILSMIALMVTIGSELIDAIRIDKDFSQKGEEKQEEKIKCKENESVMSFGTKSKK